MTMIHTSDPWKGGVVSSNASKFLNSVNCSSEHFMLAIKRGSVTRVPNVDCQGRPTVKFKDYISVYECDGANKIDPDQPFSRQTNGSRCSSIDCHVKLEMPSPEEGDYLGRSNNNVDGICESMLHKNDADMETDHDEEPSGMTLQELKIKCKKRKMIKSFVSGTDNARSHAYGLESRTSVNASIEPVDNESDLEEPLIILTEKLLRKNKLERKRKKSTHPSSPDSVIPTLGINELKGSCFNPAQSDQSFISMDGRSPERAISMDSGQEFNLKNIKEETESQTAVAADECSTFSSLSEQDFYVCSVKKRASEVCNGDILSFENYQTTVETNEISVDTRYHALTSIQEQDLGHIGSPQASCCVKKEIMESFFLGEQEAVNIGQDSAFDPAKCQLPGQSMDEAFDWHTRREPENARPSSIAEQSQCASKDEVSIEHPPFSCQVSLQESAEDNFGGVEISFSTLLCTFDPNPTAAYHGSEFFDRNRSTIRDTETMSESFELMPEQCDYLACTEEIYLKASNSIGKANTFRGKCKINDNSTCRVPFQNTEMGSPEIKYDEMDCSNDLSSKNSEASVGLGTWELVGEIPTGMPVEYRSLQVKEHSKLKIATSTFHSSDPNCLSSISNCSKLIDACVDTSGEEVIAEVEEKMYSLKVQEENTCSDVQCLEAMEGRKCFSQDCDQVSRVDGILLEDIFPGKIDQISTHLREMSSNEGSNQFNEISSSQDVYECKEVEALRCMLEHPPIKLMSNRKAFSPTSQEKLCQAVDAEADKDCRIEKKFLSENRANNSSPPESGHRILERLSSPERIKSLGTGKRLLFEKRVDPTTSESSYRVREIMLSSERASKKSRNGSKPPTTRGILKSSLPCMRPCSCTESSLIRKQTQEAITFSQRQMQDIESLATKLVKGLMSMKSIVETSLNSETCLSEPSKHNTDELRIAIDNASELEDTTKRWLSMMGRDCNRFCKILKSTMHKTAAQIDGLRKDRRKITFADEVGGILCHVKVFEDQSSSLVDSADGKADPFPQTLVHQSGN